MSRIRKNIRPKIFNPTNLKTQKPNPIKEKTLKSSSKLERVPEKEYFDYSTEEKGYFTRRDSKGKVLEVISLIFPR